MEKTIKFINESSCAKLKKWFHKQIQNTNHKTNKKNNAVDTDGQWITQPVKTQQTQKKLHKLHNLEQAIHNL